MEIVKTEIRKPIEKKDIHKILEGAGYKLTVNNLREWSEVEAITGPLEVGARQVIYPRESLFEAYANLKLKEIGSITNKHALAEIRAMAIEMAREENPAYTYQENGNGELEVVLKFSPDEMPVLSLLAHAWLLGVKEAMWRWDETI